MEINTNWVDLSISRGPIRGDNRSRVGLIYRIKARPEIEEFMKGQSSGNKLLVEAISDAWTNVTPSNPVLEYYDADIANGHGYTLTAIGGAPLITPDARRLVGGQEEAVNLSFLKLAGISHPDGLVVGFAGAYSADYIVSRLRVKVAPAIKQFLEDYIVPITINLQIVNKSF
jgi:hypothetical protein